jgi:UDP-glucuronate decarboxylase
MRIIVTGGAGFIGSHLCEFLLAQKHEVVCIDNMFTSHRENIAHLFDHRDFEFYRHDVCDPWHIECDQIYHLACPASPVHYQRNPVRTIETAMMGTRNALECARNTRARLLITSTSEVYGDPEVHPQKESYWGHVNPLGPRACYDEGKRIGESLAVAWANQYGTDVRIARLFNTYGPRMAFRDGRLIPNFILQAMQKEPLTVYGDGSQTRSFCYVSDTVDALVKLMEVNFRAIKNVDVDTLHQRIPVVNIGNPDERTIKSVAMDVISAFGGEGDIVMKPLPTDDPKQRCPDIALAKKFLGWEPKVPYDQGIAKTIAWYLKRGI